MKNLLVITPMYKIIDRNDLTKDTECVHDLIKYWKSDCNIHVIFPYIRKFKELPNFFNKKRMNYYKNGYDYDCDGIHVTIIERQNIYPKQLDGLLSDKKRFNKIINERIGKIKDKLDTVIVHIPSSNMFFFKGDDYNCKKIAILHYSDILHFEKKGELLIDYLNNNFDAIFCRSKSIYDKFSKCGLKNLHKEIIYSGVPKYDISIEKNDLKNNKLNFLYVGKLIKRKNLDLLIEVLSTFNKDSWNLEVIGSGPFDKNYKELTKKLNLESNVQFLGTLDKKDVYKHMQKSDVFCMPSVRETLGLVYIEAMLNGCITIGTKNEGIDGIIIDGENGFLVSPNQEELKFLINRIINLTDKEKHDIIKKAKQTGLCYNEEDMSIRYRKIIDEVKYERKNRRDNKK